MSNNINIIKGIHPGFILQYELKKRKIAKGKFALSLNEYPQTLVSITKGKRNMNTSLAMKIERSLGLEEGYFMILQVYYEIEKEKNKLDNKHPDLTKIRRVLFWDTDFDKIKWEKHKRSIIKRVFERGDQDEQREIIRFYGKETVDSILKKK